MANGFSLTRHDGLPVFAERFAAAGIGALVFDYRFFGDSEGLPRQRFRISEQLVDWRNAWAFLHGLEEVDQQRLAAWGYSFGGAHVATLLGRDELRPRAALALAPFLDGLGRILATPPSQLARVLPRALADSLLGHRTIPVTAPPGRLAAMNLPGEEHGFGRAVAAGSPWRNQVSPGVFSTVALHRPHRLADRIGCPLWVGLGERDITAPARAIEQLAGRAPGGELHRYDLDHFEPLAGDPAAAIAADQAEFLAAHL